MLLIENIVIAYNYYLGLFLCIITLVQLVRSLVYANAHTGKAFFSMVVARDSGTDRQPLPQESVPFITRVVRSTSALFKFLD